MLKIILGIIFAPFVALASLDMARDMNRPRRRRGRRGRRRRW